MKINKVHSDAIKLYETSQVKLKTAGNTRVRSPVYGWKQQLCSIQNSSKDKYLDKQTFDKIKKDKAYDSYEEVLRDIVFEGINTIVKKEK